MNSDLKGIIEIRMRLLNFEAEDLSETIDKCYRARGVATNDTAELMNCKMTATRASGSLKQVGNELEFLNLIIKNFANPEDQ